MVSALLKKDIVSTRKEELGVIPSNKTTGTSTQVAADNLFDTSISTNQNKISDTVQPSVSIPQNTDVFSGGTHVPSAGEYNSMASTGTGIEKDTMANALKTIINKVWGDIKTGVEEDTNLFEQVPDFFKSAIAGFEYDTSKAAQTYLLSEYLRTKDKDKAYSDYAKKLSENIGQQYKEQYYPDLSDKTFQESLKSGDWGSYAKGLGFQAGQMYPSILANVGAGMLSKGSRLAIALGGASALAPSLFPDIYDRYKEIEGVDENTAYTAAWIASITEALIENVEGVQKLFGKNPITSKIRNKILRYTVNILKATGGEVGEEELQTIVEDIGGAILGEETPYSDIWSFVKGYGKKLLDIGIETTLATVPLVGGPSLLSTHTEIVKEKKEEEKKKENTAYLYDISREADSFEAFKDLAAPFKKTEEELKEIWDDTTAQRMYNQGATQEEIDAELTKIDESIEESNKEDNVTQLTESIRELNTQKELEEIKKNIKDLNNKENEDYFTKLSQLALQYSKGDLSVERQGGITIAEKPIFSNGRYSVTKTISDIIINENLPKTPTTLSRDEAIAGLLSNSEELTNLQNQKDGYTKLKNALKKLPDVSFYNKNALDSIRNLGIKDNRVLDDIYSGNINFVSQALAEVNSELSKLNKELKKTTEKLTEYAKDYSWSVQYDSVDSYAVGFSDFVIKYAITGGKLNMEKKFVADIFNEMSEKLNVDVSKIFEGCKIILVDHGQINTANQEGDFKFLIDGEGTPIILINTAYNSATPKQQKSTIIHEVGHAIDFIYAYRKGGASLVARKWYQMVGGTFDSILDRGEFFTERQALDKNIDSSYKRMSGGSLKSDYRHHYDYYHRPTEIVARMFEQYVGNDNKFIENIIGYFDDEQLVKDTIDRFIKNIKYEFNLGDYSAEQSNIDKIISQFNTLDVMDYVTSINNVGKNIKELTRKYEELTDEQQKNLVSIDLVGNMLQLDLLVEQGIDYSLAVLEKNTEITEITANSENELKDLMSVMREIYGEAKKSKKELNELEGAVKLGIAVREGISGVKKTDVKTLQEYNDKQEKEANSRKRKEVISQISSFIKDGFVPTLTRLEQLSPRLAGGLVTMETRTMQKVAGYNVDVKDFVDNFNKLSDNDKWLLHKELFNYGSIDKPTNEQRGVLLGLAKEMGIDLEPALTVIDKLKEDALNAGININEQELYYPREVKDYEGLVKYLDEQIEKGLGDEEYKKGSKYLVNKIKKISQDTKLTPERKAKEIRELMSDLSRRRISLRPQHTKSRTITNTEDWGDNILAYYEMPDKALIGYIADMQDKISRNLFLGKGLTSEMMQSLFDEIQDMGVFMDGEMKKAIRDYISGAGKTRTIDAFKSMGVDKDTSNEIIELIDRYYGEDTEQSITNLLERYVSNGLLDRDNVDEVKHLLSSYFGRRPTPKLIQEIKNLTYILYLGHIVNTITQLGDIAASIATSPSSAMRSIIKAVLGKSSIDVVEVGIENIYEDMKQDGALKSGRILDWVLGKSLFKQTDMKMKEILMTTIVDKFHRMANGSKKNQNLLYQTLISLYGKEMGNSVYDSYKTGEIRDEYGALKFDVVVDVLYNLGQSQPLLKSAMPTAYNNNPALRVVYSLHTFWLKVLDFIGYGVKRRYRLYKQAGISKPALKAGARGVSALLSYTLADEFIKGIQNVWNSMLAIARSLITGDDDDWGKLEDTVLYQWYNNGFKAAGKELFSDALQAMLGLIGFNSSVKYAGERMGITGAVLEFLSPAALSTVGDFIESLLWCVNGVFGKNVIPTSWVEHPVEFLYHVPMIGDVAYWGGLKEYAKEHKSFAKKKEKNTDPLAKYK